MLFGIREVRLYLELISTAMPKGVAVFFLLTDQAKEEKKCQKRKENFWKLWI